MVSDDLIVKLQPDQLTKPGYAMIQNMPCKLTEIKHMPKATANGNKRVHLVGLHVFTGKKYEDTINCTAGFHGIDCPVTSKASYTLLDVDQSTGFLSLLADSGDTKEDASLNRSDDGSFDEIGDELVKFFEAGEAVKVTVLSIMGKDIVIEVTKDAAE
mmetsp:Transcript_93583/g.166497  ORF Transcript_93583/g.166497 Transcript_93583/m.166497 type:complete len:158 (+) Transcript_93583:54-527(+)